MNAQIQRPSEPKIKSIAVAMIPQLRSLRALQLLRCTVHTWFLLFVGVEGLLCCLAAPDGSV